MNILANVQNNKRKIFLIVLFALIYCKENRRDVVEEKKNEPVAEIKDEMYVTALNGLVLRERPELRSKAISLIPFGTKVLILKRTDYIEFVKDDILSIKGDWYLAEYQNLKGYVFSYYLESYPKEKAEIKLERQLLINQRSFTNNPFQNIGDFTQEKDLIKFFSQHWGEPIKIKSSPEAKPYGNTFIEAKFSSVELSILRLKQSAGREVVLHLIINSNYKDELKYGMKMNTSIKKLENIFGKDYESDCNEKTCDFIVFRSVHGYSDFSDHIIFSFNPKHLLTKIEITSTID